MNLAKLKELLTTRLKLHVDSCLPRHPFGEAYRYALFPPGKLFRPLLVAGIALDRDPEALENPWSNHSLLASFVEVHHAYTLVHDDLPCMDDDDMRRGRPSLHKRFGQWQALLVGDGLQAAGHQLLAKVEGKGACSLRRFATRALGPSGLIQGQALDLAGEMKRDFATLLETHKQKTARLIQVCLAGSRLLLENHPASFKSMLRLGLDMGLLFQLLDDLSELAAPLSERECQMNVWLDRPKQAKEETLFRHLRVQKFLADHKGQWLPAIVGNYLQGMLRQQEEFSAEVDLKDFFTGLEVKPTSSA